MAAYLGKISAVISANTQDFTRKLSTAKDDVERFKNKLDGMRLNLNTRALDGTLTKLQLFQRTMQEARQLKIDVTDLRRMYRLFEDVGRPLTNVKNQVEGLSVAVQAQLYPSLGLAQKGFQDLYRRVQAGGKASRDEVNALIAQVERLDASLSVVKGIASLNSAISVGSAGPTFVQGRAQDALMNAAKARAAAGRLPGGVREDPFFQSVASETAAAGNQIEVLTAKVEKFKLALSNNAGLASSPKFMQSFADAQSQLDATAEKLNKLNAMLSGRTGNIVAADTLTEKSRKSLASPDAERKAIIERYRDQVRGFSEMGMSPSERQAQQQVASAEATKALHAEKFDRTVVPKVSDMIERAGKSGDASLVRQAENIRKLALDTQAASGNAQVFTGKMQALAGVIEDFGKKLSRTEQAQKTFRMFLSASGGSGDKLDASIEGAAIAHGVARQLRGNYGAENVSGRIATTTAIEKSEERIQTLIKKRLQLEGMSHLSNEKKAKGLVRIQKLVEAERDAIVKTAARNSNGVFNEEQAMRSLLRGLKNQGSMGAGRFAGADLAFQQAAFAVDDFMSATGGVEYKIRAISNNITQMGLMLGQSGVIPWLTATRGLFISLGAVMAGQLLIQFVKHSRLFEDYEKKGELINEMLSKQHDRAKAAASAFSELAKAIRESSMSEGGAVGADRRRQLDEATRKNRELLGDKAAMQDPSLLKNLAEQDRLREQQKKNAGNPAIVSGNEILLEKLQREEREIRKRLSDTRAMRVQDVGMSMAAFERQRIGSMAVAEAHSAMMSGPEGAANIPEITARMAAAQQAVQAGNFGSLDEAVAATRAQLEKTAASLQDTSGAFSSPLAFKELTDQVSKLSVILAALERAQADKAFESLARSVYGAADDIDAAQSRLTKAVEAGVPMALTLQLELDALAKELGDALSESSRLREAGDRTGAEEAARRAGEIANRRGDVVARARSVGETARSQPLSFFDGMSEALKSQAETVISKRGVYFNEGNRLRGGELNRQAQISGNPQDLAKAEGFSLQMKEIAERFLTATMASNEFGKALDRFSTGLGNTVANELQGEEGKARREANKAEAGLRQAVVGTGPRRAFEAAKADAQTLLRGRRNGEDTNLFLQQELERERFRFEQGILQETGAQADVNRAKSIRALDERAADMTLPAGEQLAAKQEAERLRQDQRLAFEATPQARMLRENANNLDAQQQVMMQKIERQQRGREMVVSDTQKRREEAERKAADAVAALTEQRDGKDVFAIGKERNDAAKTAMAAMARDIAPAFVGYGEEVKNAQLGGPSRQALNASDITTMQGQSELSRLLRGDDPSKDINLVELQKQTAALEGIEQILINQAVVDFR